MAVTNIDILDGKDQPPPSGWHKDNHDLNEGAGGDYLYLTWETDGSSGAVTDLYVLDGQGEAPSGYTKIDVDLNKGAGGDYLYLCFAKGGATPITDLCVISSSDPNANPPAGFKRYDLDLNKGAKGKYIYLCYKLG
ncbi:hypothetical protein [Kitasatospora sp. NPDC101183]|uniref:hypothetical protein n=1 Tax=Kitasatospora sp. NPDC101183 TaxID=3364100 RepID=UPI003820C4E6